MRRKWLSLRRLFAAVLVAGTCILGAIPVYANVDEMAVAAAEAEAQAQSETAETQAQTEAPVEQTETTAESEPVIDRSNGTFSVPGNGEVLDDISGDSTKEFYTIRTANNNTFYMVIDKSSNTENVYMLSMIDENDLNEFLEENTETEAPVVTVLPEETEPATEMIQQEEDPNTDAGTTAGSLVLVGLVAAVGIGAYYFLKIRSKKENEGTESENLEMDDGLEMINEDEE